MSDNTKNISKFLSLVLRHKPEQIGLTLDQNGWASVTELLAKLHANGSPVSMELLEEIVDSNNKKRFAFNNDKTQIRASQGHSIEIDLDIKACEPPALLFHGTAEKNLESILASGLKKQNRQHVHLSDNTDTAKNVGARHGRPVVLQVNAGQMQKDGFTFYLSANNVWLTDEVPAVYLGLPL
ncbi:RNA 2'-phosphotransferase [Terrimonas sp. NA20]|uniref:Probable RNA 2'-phosphotransferase n=1 Tax=Terrimonas ginsenosidimutans TaxID=2908004 RepID=A0ABS9KYW7_9BACT|nr:RNA 2'-phosphotransferase [Terrimonas ginsenosidimutans]MCG2617409.1 RNA 2'-phosphotransferase [Terrimonas ginsenosidimutans]